jgi:N-acetylglucosaminyl-diphospho-decaprenol L-rhamnosyltransferase
MELSIIITGYKNPDLLKLCVDYIKKDLSLAKEQYEIIVAYSQAEETTKMMMRENYPEILFFPFAKNVGFQALVKKGIENSSGQYLLILNSDIIIKKDSIEKLLTYMRANPTVGMVGPRLVNFNETLQYSCFRFYSPITILYRRTFLGRFGFAKKHLDKFLMKDSDPYAIREADWLMGSALLVARQALEKVGLMDEQFKMYMEDTDWCRRFWENNYKVVYFPLAEMYHYHGRGSAGKGILRLIFFNKLTRLHIFSALKYFLKYFGKPLPKHN